MWTAGNDARTYNTVCKNQNPREVVKKGPRAIFIKFHAQALCFQFLKPGSGYSTVVFSGGMISLSTYLINIQVQYRGYLGNRGEEVYEPFMGFLLRMWMDSYTEDGEINWTSAGASQETFEFPDFLGFKTHEIINTFRPSPKNMLVLIYHTVSYTVAGHQPVA